MKRNKLKTRQKKRSGINKEKLFIEYGTKTLMFLVISFSIIFSAVRIYNEINDANYDNMTDGLTALTAEVDTTQIITNQLSDENKSVLIDKIVNSGLDILTDNEVDYDKYNADEITLNETISFTDQEIGQLYSYLHVANTGAYDVRLYQIEIRNIDNGYIINTVASIDFNKLFTSKLTNVEDDGSLPKRVYVINSVQVVNSEYTYDKVKYNNLTVEESNAVSESIKQVNTVDMDKYVPNQITAFLGNLAIRTGSTLEIKEDNIIFNKSV